MAQDVIYHGVLRVQKDKDIESILYVGKSMLRFSLLKYREVNISCRKIMIHIFLNEI